MKQLKQFLVLALLICMNSLLLAQQEYRGAEKTYSLKVGTTKPIRDLLPRTPTDALKLKDLKATKPEYVRNFIGRRQVPVIKSGSLPLGPDPLMNRVLTRDGSIAIAPLVNVEGINSDISQATPPDPGGDVSDQYYVQTVNDTWLQVHDLSGNKIGSPFHANTIWQPLGLSSSGDPIVLFDQEVGRWFLTEFPTTGNRVLIGVSDSGDPLGSWTVYSFSTQSFPDYPKYGIWSNAYVLTTNEGGTGIAFYAINREDILNGVDTVDIQRSTIPRLPDPSWQTTQPVDWNGSMSVADDTHPMFMRINDDAFGISPVDQVEIYEIIINWENEDSTVVIQTDIPTAPYDSEFCSVPGFGFSCIPQPNGQGIDGLPYIFMNACQYRNFGTHSSVVGTFTVDATGQNDAGVRWIELRKTGTDDWVLYQEGTVGSDDGLNRFLGGISIDALGNIGLGYSVSSEVHFPSLRFTGRRASDQLGKMSVVEYEFATGARSQTGSRFGDYASMSVDNQDVFWYTGQYLPAEGDWSTKIVGFKLLRVPVDIGPRTLVSPVSGPEIELELVTACVINHGLNPQSTFEIGMITPRGNVIVESVMIDSLFTDSLYCHTFSTPVDFTEFGPHELTIFTSMVLDSNIINDTCRFTVIKQTSYDASIPRVEGLSPTICDTFVELAFVLQNAGVVELDTADIILTANQSIPDTIHWSGSLAFGEEEVILVQVSGLNSGNNAILVYAQLLGNPDQNALNDSLAFTLHVTPGGQHTTLLLTTDNFPEETTWEVLDSNNTVIFSGGPYSLDQMTFTEEWCLDTSQCYKFVLLDSYGDGITFQGVDGNFQIVNGEGIIVAALNDPNFGLADTTAFCLQSNCALFAAISINHEETPDGQNGSIRFFASNGTPPFQYSINGGNDYQAGPFFNNLSPGIYDVIVRDAAGCFYSREVTILNCDLQIMAEVTEATGAENADGSVLFSAIGGNGPLEYSLNGGFTYQIDPLFLNLLPDTFHVVIRDSVDCMVSTEVIVDFSSAVRTTYHGSLVKIYPNPTSGYVHFEVQGLNGTVELTYDILGGDGRLIRSGIAANYSGVVKGAFSLMNKPSGDYYLRFRHPRLDRLFHVIKI